MKRDGDGTQEEARRKRENRRVRVRERPTKYIYTKVCTYTGTVPKNHVLTLKACLTLRCLYMCMRDMPRRSLVISNETKVRELGTVSDSPSAASNRHQYRKIVAKAWKFLEPSFCYWAWTITQLPAIHTINKELPIHCFTIITAITTTSTTTHIHKKHELCTASRARACVPYITRAASLLSLMAHWRILRRPRFFPSHTFVSRLTRGIRWIWKNRWKIRARCTLMRLSEGASFCGVERVECCCCSKANRSPVT